MKLNFENLDFIRDHQFFLDQICEYYPDGAMPSLKAILTPVFFSNMLSGSIFLPVLNDCRGL